MSKRFESREAIANEIDWEVGIFGPEGDTELTKSWRELLAAYEVTDAATEKVMGLLGVDE